MNPWTISDLKNERGLHLTLKNKLFRLFMPHKHIYPFIKISTFLPGLCNGAAETTDPSKGVVPVTSARSVWPSSSEVLDVGGSGDDAPKVSATSPPPPITPTKVTVAMAGAIKGSSTSLPGKVESGTVVSLPEPTHTSEASLEGKLPTFEHTKEMKKDDEISTETLSLTATSK